MHLVSNNMYASVQRVCIRNPYIHISCLQHTDHVLCYYGAALLRIVHLNRSSLTYRLLMDVGEHLVLLTNARYLQDNNSTLTSLIVLNG